MNDRVKQVKSLPVSWYRFAFVGLLTFTLFMALIPGSADPTTAYLGSKAKHAITFFVLAMALDQFAFPTERFAIWKPVVLVVFGILIEILQYFTGYRTFSFIDMIIDTAGVATYFILALLFKKKAELRLAEA